MAGAELLPGMETAMDARIVARLIAEEGMTPKADLPRFMSKFEDNDLFFLIFLQGKEGHPPRELRSLISLISL